MMTELVLMVVDESRQVNCGGCCWETEGCDGVVVRPFVTDDDAVQWWAEQMLARPDQDSSVFVLRSLDDLAAVPMNTADSELPGVTMKRRLNPVHLNGTFDTAANQRFATASSARFRELVAARAAAEAAARAAKEAAAQAAAATVAAAAEAKELAELQRLLQKYAGRAAAPPAPPDLGCDPGYHGCGDIEEYRKRFQEHLRRPEPDAHAEGEHD